MIKTFCIPLLHYSVIFCAASLYLFALIAEYQQGIIEIKLPTVKRREVQYLIFIATENTNNIKLTGRD